jgi:hypothetical protein
LGKAYAGVVANENAVVNRYSPRAIHYHLSVVNLFVFLQKLVVVNQVQQFFSVVVCTKRPQIGGDNAESRMHQHYRSESGFRIVPPYAWDLQFTGSDYRCEHAELVEASEPTFQ